VSRLFGVFQPARLARPALHARPAPYIRPTEASDRARETSTGRQNGDTGTGDAEPISNVSCNHELRPRVDSHRSRLT
jgi:hypothetical protein